MDLSKKIGQLLVVGFDGTEVNDEIKELITKYHVGNIILFERNCKTPEQIFRLTQNLQKLAIESNGVPLFIAIDQENGIVTRVHDGVTVFPGNMAQSAGASVEEIEKVGYYTGEGLLALGINFNLAPSVDINNNPKNPVIGTRSYGERATQVSEKANAFIKGIQKSGTIATAKHFPGHGDTMIDSHLDLPTVNHSIERLNSVEIHPFKEAIKSGIKAIMSAHIKYPAYEEENLPATLSYKILTQLLRNELGFKGLVITDCMNMKAIDTYYGTEEATAKAIVAGADLICLSHTYQKQIRVIKRIYEAVKEGVITEDRINESLGRILHMKKEYDAKKFLETTYEETKRKLYRIPAQKLAEQISDRSMTVLKNGGLIPIRAKDILVIAPNGRTLTGVDGTRIAPNFAHFFKENAKDKVVEAIEIDDMPSDKMIEELVKKSKNRELIILCTHNAILNKNQERLVKSIHQNNDNIILIPMRNPYDAQILENLKCCILPYEYTLLAMKSLMKLLQGEIEGRGVLPISLK